MKQRLGIAQALLNEPTLLICDEPTSALDPIGRKEILDLLLIARKRTTIVFSTHILSDVEKIADSIGVLNDGKLILEGPVHKIKSLRRKDTIQMVLANPDVATALMTKINKLPFVLETSSEGDSIQIKLSNAEEYGKELMSLLVREDIPVYRYEILEPSLENVFLEVVG